jgi:hypothetical protein
VERFVEKGQARTQSKVRGSRKVGKVRCHRPWNHGSTPQDWNEGKEWKDKWMGNPPMC